MAAGLRIRHAVRVFKPPEDAVFKRYGAERFLSQPGVCHERKEVDSSSLLHNVTLAKLGARGKDIVVLTG